MNNFNFILILIFIIKNKFKISIKKVFWFSFFKKKNISLNILQKKKFGKIFILMMLVSLNVLLKKVFKIVNLKLLNKETINNIKFKVFNLISN